MIKKTSKIGEFGDTAEQRNAVRGIAKLFDKMQISDTDGILALLTVLTETLTFMKAPKLECVIDGYTIVIDSSKDVESLANEIMQRAASDETHH